MSIPFSPRALLCTAIVMTAFGAAALADLPGGLTGVRGLERDGSLPIAVGGRPEPNVQRDILNAVLAHEARRPGRGNACLRLAPEGTALESEKQEIAILARALAAGEGAAEDLVPRLDRLRNPVRPWRRADSIAQESAPPLAEEAARQLRAAETALLSAAAAGRVDLALDMSRVPAVFRSDGPGCNVLHFSAPAIAGDVAFVETSYRAGTGPPEAWLYAVVRREEEWDVEALAPNE